MKILIYDSEISGHHLEYINNIYQACKKKRKDEFIFILPQIDFDNEEYQWEKLENVTFRFLSEYELQSIKKGLARRCISESILINKICREVKVDHIILINLAPVVPILPLLLLKTCSLTGIIYHIYFWKPKGKIRNWIDKVRYYILAKSRKTKKILILNDSKSAEKLNTLFRTSKFEKLPDPLPNIHVTKIDLANKYNINPKDTVFLHFGALNWRKGTLDILKAISLLPKDSKFTFIFAGKVADEIKDEFYNLYNELKGLYKIIVIDKFCRYSYLYTLCEISHCMLMPYHISSQSSGILGHASAHHIPVIGPSSGLIGQLIKENKLGIGLENISPTILATAIMNFSPYSISDSYAKKNSLEEFQNILLD